MQLLCSHQLPHGPVSATVQSQANHLSGFARGLSASIVWPQTHYHVYTMRTGTAWVAEQALHCRTCRLVLLFPEDLGGHSSDGPASVWQTKEFMLLESLNEARRRGAFLCQLSEVDQRRPLGVLTNVPGLWPFLRLGWPSFSQSDNNLVYTGPLPRYCTCKKQHELLKRHSFSRSVLHVPCIHFWTAPLVSLFSKHHG